MKRHFKTKIRRYILIMLHNTIPLQFMFWKQNKGHEKE